MYIKFYILFWNLGHVTRVVRIIIISSLATRYNLSLKAGVGIDLEVHGSIPSSTGGSLDIDRQWLHLWQWSHFWSGRSKLTRNWQGTQFTLASLHESLSLWVVWGQFVAWLVSRPLLRLRWTAERKLSIVLGIIGLVTCDSKIFQSIWEQPGLNSTVTIRKLKIKILHLWLTTLRTLIVVLWSLERQRPVHTIPDRFLVCHTTSDPLTHLTEGHGGVGVSITVVSHLDWIEKFLEK